MSSDSDRFREYNAFLTSIHKCISGELSFCDSEQVRGRIMQEIINQSQSLFLTKALTKEHNVQWLRCSKLIIKGGIRYDAKNKNISLDRPFFLSLVIRAFYEWLKVLFELFGALFSPNVRRVQEATLVFDSCNGGGHNPTDKEIADFFRRGPIRLFRKGTIIISGQTNRVNTCDKKIYVSKSPLKYHIKKHCSLNLRIKLIVIHFLSVGRVISDFKKNRFLLFVASDLWWNNVVICLAKFDSISSMVITLSNFRAQPLWMTGILPKKFSLHMLWYSQNYKPLKFKGYAADFDWPSSRFIRADIHWVWTKSFGDYIQSLDPSTEVRVVGPILFHLKNVVLAKSSRRAIRIGLFDVIPKPPEKKVWSIMNSYYTEDRVGKFLIDTCALVRLEEEILGCQIEIFLKHKRQFLPHDNPNYYRLIQTLEKTNNLQLIAENSALYNMIDSLELAVCIPFTSVAYVASSCGKRSIFYDPTNDLLPSYEKNPLIEFCSGPSSLREALRRAITNVCIGLYPVS
jgi:hypothetical protein